MQLQGRNKVIWHMGQEASLAPTHMFETELFQKQMFWIEESTCDTDGTFWWPPSDSDLAPGELRSPRYALQL